MAWWNRKKEPAQQPAPTINRRHYEAASTDRLTASWTTAPTSPDQLIATSLRISKARAREQSRNNDYVKRYLGLLSSNVVGPVGVVMQARTKSANGQPDKPANAALEAGWREWSRREHCDIAQRLNWVKIQQLLVKTVATDGEFLVRIIRGRVAGKWGFALQPLDTELLDVSYNRKMAGGGFIKFGIEFNQFLRPIAYHLVQQDPSADTYAYGGKRYVRVPAADILHDFIPTQVGQKRGITMMATALMRLNMLKGYEDAAVVNARVGAAKMGVWEDVADVEDLAGVADDKDAAGNYLMDADPGGFFEAPPGKKLSSWDPQYPHDQFGEFVKATLRGIASGLDINYNSLANDLEGVSFSSIRAGVLEDRETWKALQIWWIDSFCRPVYEQWLPMALLTGNLRVGRGSLDPLREDKYRQVSWQPRRWAWVDPLKDQQANKLAIDEGLTSRSQVIRDQGMDPDEVWAEIESDNQKLAEHNITITDLPQTEADDDGKPEKG